MWYVTWKICKTNKREWVCFTIHRAKLSHSFIQNHMLKRREKTVVSALSENASWNIMKIGVMSVVFSNTCQYVAECLTSCLKTCHLMWYTLRPFLILYSNFDVLFLKDGIPNCISFHIINMLLNTSLCTWSTVRPNKTKHWSLEHRKIYRKGHARRGLTHVLKKKKQRKKRKPKQTKNCKKTQQPQQNNNSNNKMNFPKGFTKVFLKASKGGSGWLLQTSLFRNSLLSQLST